MDRPKWIKLRNLIRCEIDSGHLPVGEPLPSHARLRTTHQVSETVVRNAIEALRGEGLIAGRRGVGTFVVARSPSQVRKNLTNDRC